MGSGHETTHTELAGFSAGFLLKRHTTWSVCRTLCACIISPWWVHVFHWWLLALFSWGGASLPEGKIFSLEVKYIFWLDHSGSKTESFTCWFALHLGAKLTFIHSKFIVSLSYGAILSTLSSIGYVSFCGVHVDRHHPVGFWDGCWIATGLSSATAKQERQAKVITSSGPLLYTSMTTRFVDVRMNRTLDFMWEGKPLLESRDVVMITVQWCRKGLL